MDTYELKFTKLQNEIFRVLCINTGNPLNQREIAKRLDVSPTAVSKSIKPIEKENLIVVKRNKNMNLNLIELNIDYPKAIGLKRIENLKMIYESGIVEFLEEKYPGTVIILFGSYSHGEDTVKSDIDLAIIGAKDKIINTEKFNKFFEKEININIYIDFNNIHKNLKSNIFNGIVIVGRIVL